MPHTTDRIRSKELRRSYDKLTRLCRLTAEVTKLGSERSTLQKVVDAAAEIVGVRAAHLALVDKYERALYGVVSSGRHPPNAPRIRCQLSHSAAAQAALHGRRVITIKRASDDRRVNTRARDLLSIRGVAYLPLLSGGESFGLLILVTRRPHDWTRAEIDLARHFANVASVALENSRLLARLAETEGRFRSLVEHIPAIIYTCEVEPPYRTLYISPQTKTILGYSCEEWVDDGNFFLKLIHPEDFGTLVERSDAAAAGSGFATSEYRLLDHRGETRWFRDEAVLVRDPAGEAVAWHGVLVEITGIKEMQEPRAPLPAAGHGPPPSGPERPGHS